jgi:hypothetical protein
MRSASLDFEATVIMFPNPVILENSIANFPVAVLPLIMRMD